MTYPSCGVNSMAVEGLRPEEQCQAVGVILAYVLCFWRRIELVIYVTADGNIVINWAAL